MYRTPVQLCPNKDPDQVSTVIFRILMGQHFMKNHSARTHPMGMSRFLEATSRTLMYIGQSCLQTLTRPISWNCLSGWRTVVLASLERTRCALVLRATSSACCSKRAKSIWGFAGRLLNVRTSSSETEYCCPNAHWGEEYPAVYSVELSVLTAEERSMDPDPDSRGVWQWLCASHPVLQPRLCHAPMVPCKQLRGGGCSVRRGTRGTCRT